MEAQIVMHANALGPDDDYLLDAVMRTIAKNWASKEEWAEKYGTNIDNDIFMMHKFCWCESPSCSWCNDNAPNFFYKSTRFEVRWYKYIGRDMTTNRKISDTECADMLVRCLKPA